MLSWLALVGGALAGLLVSLSVRSRRPALVLGLATATTLALVVAAQLTPVFDGYDTDFWVNALIAERAADGRSMLHLDPFLLQPPPTPHVSLPWLLAGEASGITGLSVHAIARGLAGLSALLLALATYRLAGRLFEGSRLRWTAVLLFALGFCADWPTLPLGRTLAVPFVFLALAESLVPGWSLRRVVLAALWVALAFYTHLFGGILALLGVACATLARTDASRDRARTALATGLLAVLLAAPCFVYALHTAGLERSHAHLERPGQEMVLGLRTLGPAEVVRLAPVPLLLLALVGVVRKPPPGQRVARRIAVAGMALWALVLFTPVYDLAVRAVGGWMPERLVHLALLWVAATLALAAASEARGARAAVFVGAAVLALGAQDGLELVRNLEDRPLSALLPFGTASRAARRGGEARLYYEMSGAARREARALRPLMHERWFVSDPLLGYGIAASSLGLPLAVPAGHVSPFGDFAVRATRVRNGFAVNSAACWSRLLAVYPEVELLLTPAPGAVVESLVWGRRGDPERVRRLFAEHGALRPLFRGRFYVLDAIRSPLDASGLRSDPGRGSQCEAAAATRPSPPG